MWVYATYVYPQKAEEGIILQKLDLLALMRRQNSGPLEEQKVIFSIKPPLQPQYFILYHGIVTEINFLFRIWDICC